MGRPHPVRWGPEQEARAALSTELSADGLHMAKPVQDLAGLLAQPEFLGDAVRLPIGVRGHFGLPHEPGPIPNVGA